MRRRLIGVLASVGLVLAMAAPASAISYGQLDTNGDYANVGALLGEWEGDLYVFCTGTLIAPDVFLTASHCVDDGLRMWVSFDSAITEPVTSATNTIYPGTAHQHPMYACCGQSNTYDVAVIVLDDPVTGITPASLPTLNQLGEMSKQELNAATFTTAGYGTVRDVKATAGQALYWDPQRRFATQEALSLQPYWLTLSMNLATGNGGTCYGDSGGPHFLGDTVVSLTVTGDAWCKASDKTYRVDTQVARDFLDDFVTLP